MKSGESSCLLTRLAVSYNQQNLLPALLGDNVKGVVKAEPFHCLTTPHSPSYPVPNVSEDGEESRVKSRWKNHSAYLANHIWVPQGSEKI